MTAPKQARAKSSLNSFNIEVERSDPTVTAFAGLPLAIEAWHALGLRDACDKHLALKVRDRGLSDAEWIELLVILRVSGGERPPDLKALEQDPGLKRLWDLPGKVSERAVYPTASGFGWGHATS